MYNSKSFIKAEGVVSRILMDTPSGKERIAPLIYWSKGILREDMQEFLIGKLCPDTSISELFKLLSLPFFLNKNPLTATLFRVKRSLLRMLVVS